MKIIEIYVEAKKSRNFQTYTAGLRATVDDEEADGKIKLLQAKCRKLVMEQIMLDGK